MRTSPSSRRFAVVTGRNGSGRNKGMGDDGYPLKNKKDPAGLARSLIFHGGPSQN